MDFETGDDVINLKESLAALPDPTEWTASDLDLDPAEYARYNDLTVDSLQNPWPACFDDRLLATLSPAKDGDLIEVEGLQECFFREVIPAPEQLQMSAPSLRLIQEACKSVSEPGVAELMAELRSAVSSEPKPVAKVELPVLRTDHDSDCRQLARKIAKFRNDQLADHRLPLHPVNEELGESVEFSAKAKRGDEAVMKGVAGESLEMTRQTFRFLSQCLKADMAESDKRAFLDEGYTYKGVRSRDHLTPPLSPQLQPSEEYFVPDDDTCEIPVSSSDNDAALAAELEATESNIFQDDIQFWANAVSRQIPSPERYKDLDIAAMIKAGELSGPSPFSSPKPPPRSLKMDVPLLPNSSNDNKDKTPTQVLTAADLAQAKTFIDSSDKISAGPRDHDEQFAEFLRSKGTAIMRSAEQEKLQPLDATLRMPVRVMDFSQPAPEWGTCPWKPDDMFRWIQKGTDTVWQSPKWPANKLAEQAMVWRPLAHMDRMIAVTEGLDCDDRVFAMFLDRPSENEVMMSEDLVKKDRGLVFRRPRDDCDSEVDVEEEMYQSLDSPSVLEESRGHIFQPDHHQREIHQTEKQQEPRDRLFHPEYSQREIYQPEKQQELRGRLFQLEHSQREIYQPEKQQEPRGRLFQPGHSQQEIYQPEKQHRSLLNEPPRTQPTPSSGTMALQSRRLLTTPTPTPAPLHDLSALLKARKRSLEEMEQQRGPHIGSTNILSGFLDLHVDSAPLISNFIQISNAHKKPKLTDSPFFSSPTPPTAKPATHATKLNKEEAARLMPPPPKPVPAFSPPITPPAIPPKVIVSFALSKHLIQHIKTALPSLILIERNYTAHPPAPMDDADMTISPATGLLFTTMVKLRQKSLPGSTTGSTNPFRHLITTVASRYERLIVLVSEGNKHSETMSPLSRSDAKALAEAQGFAAALAVDTDVQLVYVGGGVETLARWAAHFVCRYAHEAPVEVQKLVMAMETGWELFLRRAGMNAYAAQVALGRLEVPKGEPAMGGERRYGLPLLVGMSVEERARVLGGVLGGTRVLERVGRVIDGGWRTGSVVGGEVQAYGAGPPRGEYGVVGGAGARRVAYGVGASPGGHQGMGM